MSHFFFNRLCLACIFSLFVFEGMAQPYYNQRPEYIKANSVWALASSNGFNFNTTPATTVPLPCFSMEGVASVADPVTGALLFFTNGVTCWNADNLVMPNGDFLLGNIGVGGQGPSTTQGVCIVPFIDQPGKYYLFSMNGPTSWNISPQPDTFLYYSVIDMSLDGGKGDIVPGQKNIPLGDNVPLSESMIAIPGNNCDIWLMVHDYLDPVFKAFHITRNGIDPNPVVSIAGTQIQGNNGGNGAYVTGGMAISPDRKTIGITSCDFSSLDNSGVLLGKFDAGTGVVNSVLQVEEALTSYTLAFSPDNTKLYLCNMSPSASVLLPSYITQYNIGVFDSAAIATSKVTVGQTNGDYSASGYFKSYNDKIYFVPAFFGMDTLFVIDQPNLPGAACNYQPYTCTNPLGLSFSGPSLPNDVVYAQLPDTSSIVEDTLICMRNQGFENITLSAPPGYDGYLWDDGSTGATRDINAPGTYRVLCRDSCHSLIDSFVVLARDIPLSLGPDTALCNQTGFSLNATVPGGTAYLWQDNSTDPVFTASGSGTFWVQVLAAGCTVSDTITLSIKDLRQELGNDIVLCKGDAVQAVTLQANVPPGATVQWSTGSNASSIVAADTGRYWVTVSDDPCTGSDTIRVVPEVCACRMGVPNAFSPNGDGRNDEFFPVIENGCPVSNYVLNIYNRFGQRVYSGHNTGKGWDGNYKGSPADVGTYVYEISFTGGTKQIKYYRKGDMVLVR